MLTCHQVADYFLSLQDEDSGDTISNLKMQKLVYFAQVVHLGSTGRPLFAEPVEAWTHGPVVSALYHRFKEHGSSSIPSAQIDVAAYAPDERETLDEVYRVFGQFSGWKLRNMTHAEGPWKDSHEAGTDISQAAMKAYGESLLA